MGENLNQEAPQSQELARRLLTCESSSGKSSGGTIEAGIRVFEKLREPLCTLAGTEGFRSLLSRALTLAKAKAPALAEVQVSASGSLTFEFQPELNETGKSVELVLEQLLDLLITFIGQPLTLSLVMDIWPDALSGDMDAEMENKT